jgi:hypothetical protein
MGSFFLCQTLIDIFVGEMAEDVLDVLIVGDGARPEPFVGVGEEKIVVIGELVQEALLEGEKIGDGTFLIELVTDPSEELAKSGKYPIRDVAVGRSPVGFNE